MSNNAIDQPFWEWLEPYKNADDRLLKSSAVEESHPVSSVTHAAFMIYLQRVQVSIYIYIILLYNVTLFYIILYHIFLYHIISYHIILYYIIV